MQSKDFTKEPCIKVGLGFMVVLVNKVGSEVLSVNKRINTNFKVSFLIMCMCVCEHVYSAHRGQKKASAPLELELQAVPSCPKKMFGIKHGSYGKAMYVLNYPKQGFLLTKSSLFKKEKKNVLK